MMLNNDLNDYFIILLTIIATFNGVAIPLSYNIISENLKPFADKHISRIFLNETRFKTNIIVAMWSLPIFSFPLLVDIKTILNFGTDNNLSIIFTNFYILLSFFTMAGFLISFIEFSVLIYDYASNTEEIVFEKIKKELDEYLDE